uniref:Uncharacterized protein n=1 Tax=Nocardia terpenica TaxID=455432 RepID=A0A809PVM5_9NOCA|nr:hypothetical protein [Nocardia terpenica]
MPRRPIREPAVDRLVRAGISAPAAPESPGTERPKPWRRPSARSRPSLGLPDRAHLIIGHTARAITRPAHPRRAGQLAVDGFQQLAQFVLLGLVEEPYQGRQWTVTSAQNPFRRSGSLIGRMHLHRLARRAPPTHQPLSHQPVHHPSSRRLTEPDPPPRLSHRHPGHSGQNDKRSGPTGTDPISIRGPSTIRSLTASAAAPRRLRARASCWSNISRNTLISRPKPNGRQ